MTKCKPTFTLLPLVIILTIDDYLNSPEKVKEIKTIPYYKILKSLIWLQVVTCPDLSYQIQGWWTCFFFTFFLLFKFFLYLFGSLFIFFILDLIKKRWCNVNAWLSKLSQVDHTYHYYGYDVMWHKRRNNVIYFIIR